MAIKTERLTILTTPDFKAYLGNEAKTIGVSVSELVRIRCSKEPELFEDEEILKALINECKVSTARANKALDKSNEEYLKTMALLHKSRESK